MLNSAERFRSDSDKPGALGTTSKELKQFANEISPLTDSELLKAQYLEFLNHLRDKLSDIPFGLTESEKAVTCQLIENMIKNFKGQEAKNFRWLWSQNKGHQAFRKIEVNIGNVNGILKIANERVFEDNLRKETGNSIHANFELNTFDTNIGAGRKKLKSLSFNANFNHNVKRKQSIFTWGSEGDPKPAYWSKY